jgi:DNA mismatch repair ATPase MutL
MHILDIVENAISAGADVVSVLIEEKQKDDVLSIEIRDNGEGMDEWKRKQATDPFFTTKGKKVGLGLPLLAEAARRSGGDIQISSLPGYGTSIKTTFGLTHIDRQPLGDIIETMTVLIVGHPDVEFICSHIDNEKENSWGTQRIREHFEDDVTKRSQQVHFIREELNKIFRAVHA